MVCDLVEAKLELARLRELEVCDPVVKPLVGWLAASVPRPIFNW